MLCDDCIVEITRNLTPEAIKIFKLIKNNKLTRKEIKDKTGYSHSITFDRVNELEHKMLVTYRERGRAKVYGLTKVGKRYYELKIKK